MPEHIETLTPTRNERGGYCPTEDELRELARHWAQVELKFALDYFFYAQVGSSDRRLRDHASERLSLLAEHLGGAIVPEIEADVEEVERHNLGPDLWSRFASGNLNEWHEVINRPGGHLGT